MIKNKTVILLILWLIFTACNGQNLNKSNAFGDRKDAILNKIPIPENGFSNAVLSRDGSLWFSSNGNGVFHFDGIKYINYTEKDGLGSNQVFCIVEDSKNNLWFGTQNGLTKYDGNQFENISLPFQDTSSIWLDKMYPVINPNAVHALAVDDGGYLWLGTAGGGAYQYDGNSFQPYLRKIGKKQEDSLFHNWIPFIRKDNKGDMWFASMTHGGVSRFDGSEFTQFLIKDGLSEDQVRTIFCDKDGNIWMGFNGNRNSGLTVFDGKSFVTYSQKDGLCNKRIRAIFEDSSGNIWLGTDLGELCIFDGQKFSKFEYKGQTYTDILFILSDSTKNIWFGGSKGVWKYTGEEVVEMTINK